MKKYLLAVQGPLQFIAAFVAMEWARHISGCDDECEATIFIYDLYATPDVELELVRTIEKLSLIRNWTKIIFVDSEEMSSLIKGRYVNSLRRLRHKIGEDKFDEIYLARDFLGEGSQLLMNAYPQAKKIIYGDGLGQVGYEKKFRISIRNVGAHVFLKHSLKKLLKQTIFGGPKKYPFDCAILILPIDHSFSYLRSLPLFIPEKQFVVNIFTQLTEQSRDLQSYCQRIFADTNNEVHLILLSNFFASGFISLENEKHLYLEVISKNIPLGATIFLKPHPRSDGKIIEEIKSSLGARYDIKTVDDQKYLRVPIELWLPLIKKTTLFPIFSSSAMHLKYLYGVNVKMGIDDVMIRKYFYPSKIEYLIKGNKINCDAIEELSVWDGLSPLLIGAEN